MSSGEGQKRDDDSRSERSERVIKLGTISCSYYLTAALATSRASCGTSCVTGSNRSRSSRSVAAWWKCVRRVAENKRLRASTEPLATGK